MSAFKFTPYFVRVKKKYTDNYLDLEKIPTGNGDEKIINILWDMCQGYNKDVYLKDEEQKTMFIEDLTNDNKNHIVSGITKTGEYGIETDFYDTKNRKRIPSARKKEHSEEKPFFFLFHTPRIKNKEIGILILQKFKQFGMKSIFESALKEKIITLNSDLIIEIHPIINNTLLEELEKSDRLVELKLIKRKVPKDVADKNLIENYEDIYEERSFKVRKKRDLKLKPVKDRILSSLKNIHYPYIEIQDEFYDEVKLIVEEGGSKRTISITDLPKFRENMPLNDDELKFDKGFPTKDSLLPLAKKYVEDINKKIDENPLSE